MQHVHVKAVLGRSRYKSIVEVCNDGVRLFKLEGGKYSKTKEQAEEYAMLVGKRFLKELDSTPGQDNEERS